MGRCRKTVSRFMFLGGCLLLVVAGCSRFSGRFEQPKLQLIGLRVLDARMMAQRTALTFRVLNPNEQALPIVGMYYELELEGDEFASGVSNQAVTIPAYGEAEVTVEVSTSLWQIIRQFAGMMKNRKQSFHYHITGHLRVDLPLVGKVPIDTKGSIRLDDFVPPEARPQ